MYETCGTMAYGTMGRGASFLSLQMREKDSTDSPFSAVLENNCVKKRKVTTMHHSVFVNRD